MKEEDFQGLLQSFDEARRFFAGENVPGLRVHFRPEGGVRAIRRRTGLTQAAFAKQIDVPLATLRQWEQGRRCPTGPACVLLEMLAKNPNIVARTLAETA